MPHNHHEQLQMLLAEVAAKFIARESNRTSLITLTRSELNDSHTTIIFYITVLPESAEDDALNFLKRQRSELKHFIKKHATIHRIPFVDFEIDRGEKSRQRLDELSQEL